MVRSSHDTPCSGHVVSRKRLNLGPEALNSPLQLCLDKNGVPLAKNETKKRQALRNANDVGPERSEQISHPWESALDPTDLMTAQHRSKSWHSVHLDSTLAALSDLHLQRSERPLSHPSQHSQRPPSIHLTPSKKRGALPGPLSISTDGTPSLSPSRSITRWESQRHTPRRSKGEIHIPADAYSWPAMGHLRHGRGSDAEGHGQNSSGDDAVSPDCVSLRSSVRSAAPSSLSSVAGRSSFCSSTGQFDPARHLEDLEHLGWAGMFKDTRSEEAPATGSPAPTTPSRHSQSARSSRSVHVSPPPQREHHHLASDTSGTSPLPYMRVPSSLVRLQGAYCAGKARSSMLGLKGVVGRFLLPGREVARTREARQLYESASSELQEGALKSAYTSLTSLVKCSKPGGRYYRIALHMRAKVLGSSGMLKGALKDYQAILDDLKRGESLNKPLGPESHPTILSVYLERAELCAHHGAMLLEKRNGQGLSDGLSPTTPSHLPLRYPSGQLPVENDLRPPPKPADSSKQLLTQAVLDHTVVINHIGANSPASSASFFARGVARTLLNKLSAGVDDFFHVLKLVPCSLEALGNCSTVHERMKEVVFDVDAPH